MAALSEIEKLEARWAENPDGRYFAPLADAYRKAGRVDDAIQVVAQGLAKHPDYLSAHIVMGRCFLEKQDDGGARSAFDKVLSLDSENIIALKSLAEIAERIGEPEAARRWLQRLLIVDQMNTEAADDLDRLGGPLPEEGEAPEAEAEAPSHISFADLAVPEEAAAPEPVAEPVVHASSAPTMPTPALDMSMVPKTLERPAIKFPFQQAAPEPTPEPEPVAEPEPLAAETAHVPMLELESTTFEPPSADAMPASVSEEFVPFDDQLAWGAGERTSQAISAEDIANAERRSATAPAIEFMGGAPEAHAAPPEHEAPAEPPAPARGWADPNMATLPMDSIAPPLDWAPPVETQEPAETVDALKAVDEATPTREMTPVTVAPMAADIVPPPPPPEPEPVAVAAEPVDAPTALPLIMPEDVTPAEEMRRPSSKQLHMVSPDVEAPPAEVPAEPMVTETMGDLYLRQGLKDQAADVYRRLLALRPGDASLTAKLAAIESPPAAMSAAAQGSEAVGTWLQRIARAQFRSAAPSPPPVAEAGPSPMEQAFGSAEPESEASAAPAPASSASAADDTPAGNPARLATDQFSLDQIFGATGQSAAAPPPQAPAPHAMGSSFDDFFGAAPKTETVRPRESAPDNRQSEGDLSAFNAWLHGLKR